MSFMKPKSNEPPTFIVSTAIATRDYQDVHHDRDKAQAKGSKDIFVNILTDTGLVQRYVTDWAGPDALVRRRTISMTRSIHPGQTATLTGTGFAHSLEPARPASVALPHVSDADRSGKVMRGSFTSALPRASKRRSC